MKQITVSILFILIFTACGSTTPTAPALSQDNAIETALAQVSMTQTAMASVPSPTATNAPPSPTVAAPVSENRYAWNYIASQDSGSVIITIGRLVIAEKSAIPSLDFSSIPLFDDRPVIGEIIFIIENKTASIVSVYPDQGKVLAGSEQIELFDFAIAGANISSSDYSGDVLPGARLIGGLWFGFQRTAFADINSLTIYISGPFDQSITRLGPDYNFVLDLTEKRVDPLPDELK